MLVRCLEILAGIPKILDRIHLESFRTRLKTYISNGHFKEMRCIQVIKDSVHIIVLAPLYIVLCIDMFLIGTKASLLSYMRCTKKINRFINIFVLQIFQKPSNSFINWPLVASSKIRKKFLPLHMIQLMGQTKNLKACLWLVIKRPSM